MELSDVAKAPADEVVAIMTDPLDLALGLDRTTTAPKTGFQSLALELRENIFLHLVKYHAWVVEEEWQQSLSNPGMVCVPSKTPTSRLIGYVFSLNVSIAFLKLNKIDLRLKNQITFFIPDLYPARQLPDRLQRQSSVIDAAEQQRMTLKRAMYFQLRFLLVSNSSIIHELAIYFEDFAGIQDKEGSDDHSRSLMQFMSQFKNLKRLCLCLARKSEGNTSTYFVKGALAIDMKGAPGQHEYLERYATATKVKSQLKKNIKEMQKFQANSNWVQPWKLEWTTDLTIDIVMWAGEQGFKP